MKLATFVVCAMLCGCAMTDNLATYDATVSTPGREYAVHNKHGSLLIVEESDGTKITADDRGHPAEPGIFDKVIDFATVTAAAKIGD